MLWHRGRAYGQDLRDRVLSAPGSIAQIAARFAVSAAYVSKVRRSRRLGQLSAGAQCNHVPAKLAGLEPAVAVHLAAQDDQ